MADPQFITQGTLDRRKYWLAEIAKVSGHFVNDTAKLSEELGKEFESDGDTALFDHLRTCAALPECYGHDTSEEKLYSKYTDILLAYAFRKIGLTSIVIEARGDAADVEAVADGYSFVADAKAFRLSRTAKNQKDFKIEAMHSWKHGKPFAVVVCPLYQLPTRSSQIYQQAINRDVLILSYTHLCVMMRASIALGKSVSTDLLASLFKVVKTINPSKDAVAYWTAVNRELLNHHQDIDALWSEEKIALAQSITFAKEEGLTFLGTERERIMRLSHEEAITQLIREHNIDNRMAIIGAVSDNGLMSIV